MRTKFIILLLGILTFISCINKNERKQEEKHTQDIAPKHIHRSILYGMTLWGGKNNKGVLFSYNLSTQTDTVLFNFDGINGERPTGNLLQGGVGNLFGMTLGGGIYGCGVIFRYNIFSGKDTVLLNFNGKNGKDAGGSLLLAHDSILYGTTDDGGSNDKGVLFSYNPKNMQYKVLFNFDSINGDRPCGSLIQPNDGNLYGMTSCGGWYSEKYSPGHGVIYSYDLAKGKYSILLKFNEKNGSWPDGGFIQAKDGFLYGMTHDGGSYDNGVIFRYDISKMHYTMLMSFNDTNGAAPFNNLIQGADGNMYGIAFGGNNDNGVIFQFDPKTLLENVKVNFDSLSMPYSSLTLDSEGNLYGMNSRGGKYDFGCIYCYNPSKAKYSVISSFNGYNGKYPNNSLLLVIEK